MALAEEIIEEILYGGESFTVEYKDRFDWTVKEAQSKYLKSMAAFANNQGGYLVFGVDKNDNLVGISDEFEKLDRAKISQLIGVYFQPFINFRQHSVKFQGMKFGILEIEKWKTTPVVCKKDGAEIYEGDIYYRYNSESRKIHYGELVTLLQNLRLNEETKFMMRSRKNDIQPYLEMEFSWVENKKPHLTIEPLYHFARFVKVMSIGNNQAEFSLKDNHHSLLRVGEKYGFRGDNIRTWSKPNVNIRIIFMDKDDNLYYQDLMREYIEGTLNPKQHCTSPEDYLGEL
jgi:hypothetical protein